jgi:membrane protein DedA with SNARE-associated domain
MPKPVPQQTVLMRSARYVAMATQLPFMVFAGYFAGRWLDAQFGTTWLSIVVMLVAIVGAFTQIIRQVTKDQSNKDGKSK